MFYYRLLPVDFTHTPRIILLYTWKHQIVRKISVNMSHELELGI